MAQNLKDLISICKDANRKERLKSVTKEAMADILRAADADGALEQTAPAQAAGDAGMQEIMVEILSEMRQLRTSVDKALGKTDALEKKVDHLTNENAVLQKEGQELKEEVEMLRGALMHHQRFLESVDTERRASNLIIFGIPEGGMRVGNATLEADEDKVGAVFTGLGYQMHFTELVRLGKNAPGAGERSRPIKVMIQDPRKRNTLVKDAKKKLADKNNNPFPGYEISLKKDLHPKVRSEYKRLYDVESAEKSKPENVGKNVRYVHETRCVMVDDQVVDRFQPLFF